MSKRIPGTFKEGDRIITLDHKKSGVVSIDNRTQGGQFVWVIWDNDGYSECVDPATIRSGS